MKTFKRFKEFSYAHEHLIQLGAMDKQAVAYSFQLLSRGLERFYDPHFWPEEEQFLEPSEVIGLLLSRLQASPVVGNKVFYSLGQNYHELGPAEESQSSEHRELLVREAAMQLMNYILEFSYESSRKASDGVVVRGAYWYSGKVLTVHSWGFRVQHSYGVRAYSWDRLIQVKLKSSIKDKLELTSALALSLEPTAKNGSWFGIATLELRYALGSGNYTPVKREVIASASKRKRKSHKG